MVSFKSYNINKYRNKLIDKHNNIIKGCYIIK